MAERIMNRSMRVAATVAVAIGATIATSAGADDIVLHSSVRLAPGAAEIRLRDVAELRGPAAEALGGVVIGIVEGSDVIELGVADVRAALRDADVPWGRVNLSGRRVVVRSAPRETTGAPSAMAPATLVPTNDEEDSAESASESHRAAGDLAEEHTLRGAIALHLLRELRVEVDDLRLAFDDADARILALDEASHRFELVPQSSARSDVVTLVARVWRDGGVTEEQSIAVRPLLRTSSAVLARDVARNDVITPADVEVREEWLPPMQASLTCDPESAVERVASQSLHAGDIVRRKHVRRETVVERGDFVTVRCIVGGVVITLQAEARADGAEGDTIELRKRGERETFLATVAGPSEAVLDLGARPRR